MTVEIQIHQYQLQIKEMQKKCFYINNNYFKQHPSVFIFINKIRQIQSVQEKDKKQNYMQTQQSLQNQELFNMSIDMFKQFLDIDDLQLQTYYNDQKFIAFIKCIQRVGLMLSKFYQDRQQDFIHQIQTLKKKYSDYQQKLANYMQQNQGLKQIIEHLENARTYYDEKLNKSQHEIQRGKSEILNQIHANEHLLNQYEKLNINNYKLVQQNKIVNQLAQNLQKQLNEKTQENKKTSIQVTKLKKDLEKAKMETIQFKSQKLCLQKQIESLQILIQQKDYLLRDIRYKQYQNFPYSAQQNSNYLQSIKVVKQVNQQCGSDKDILKGVQSGYGLESIMAIKFGQSRSISQTSQKSQTSINEEKISIDFQNQSPQQSKNIENNSNVIRTQKKKYCRQKTKIQQRTSFKKNLIKSQVKHSQKSNFKLVNTPIPKQKSYGRQKSLSMNIKQITHILKQKQKRKIPHQDLAKFDIKNNSNNSSQIKIKKCKQNSSVILKARTKSKDDEFENIGKKGRIQHSQSVQDLCWNNNQKDNGNKTFQEKLLQKQKYIQSLRYQNRSVRLLVEQQSQKLTQAQHQYQQQIQKLKSQLVFYKRQFRKTYADLIQQKSLNQAFRDQLQKVSQQIQDQKIIYKTATQQLKQKCKSYMYDQIAIYKEKYEELAIKMGQLENQLLNCSKQDSEGQPLQIQKQLKKNYSDKLFYNQMKHHSYNTSQQYSQINTFSANHSKNTSFLNIDDEQLSKRKDQNIKIIDYEGIYKFNDEQNQNNQMDFCNQRIDEQNERMDNQSGVFHNLQSFCQQKQTKHQQVQTDLQDENITLQLSLSNSSKFPQFQSSKVGDIQLSKYAEFEQISNQLSSYGVKSLQQFSKMKLSQQKVQKRKKLSMQKLVYHLFIVNLLKQLKAHLIHEKSNQKSQTQQMDIYCSKISDTLATLLQNNNPDAITTVVSQNSNQLQFTKNVESLTVSRVIQEQYLSQIQKQQKPVIIKCQEGTQTIFQYSQNKQIKQMHSQTQRKMGLIKNQNIKICSSAVKAKIQICQQYSLKMFDYIKNKNLNQIQSQTDFIFNFRPFNQEQTQTAYPNHNQCKHKLHSQCKIQLNQSFNQTQINQVLNDLSQSFELSARFIQTLKKKLLNIHDHIKHLQQNKGDISSSSDSGEIQKAFKNIKVFQNVLQEKYTKNSIFNQNQIVYNQYKQYCFQGNVKTSKASTKCSISTPYDSLSPNNSERLNLFEIKQNIRQFDQIKQIQSENADSLSKIQIDVKGHLSIKKKAQEMMQDDQCYQQNKIEQSCNQSVNKSVFQINDTAQNFNILAQFKSQTENQILSKEQKELLQKNRKCISSQVNINQSLQLNNILMNSPKSINKDSYYQYTINSAKSLSSVQIKNLKNQKNSGNIFLKPPQVNKQANTNIKCTKKMFQKPKELQILSQCQYQFLNRRYHIKKYQLQDKMQFSFQKQIFEAQNSKSESQLVQNMRQKTQQANQQQLCKRKCKIISNMSNIQMLLIKVKTLQNNHDQYNLKQSDSRENQFDVIALTLNKIISVKNKYIISSCQTQNIYIEPRTDINHPNCQFSAPYPILSLGNQQIIIDLKKQILKYAFSNKLNYYQLFFPQKKPKINQSHSTNHQNYNTQSNHSLSHSQFIYSAQSIKQKNLKIQKIWRYRIR